MAESLEGVRVIDMTRVVAGPLATQTLGDLGADIIKIERREGGDDVRQVGPPWLKTGDGEDDTQSTYFQTVNRNKRSITLDFAQREGAEAIRKMVATSHVFVENYRRGTLARYGLGFDDLKAINPAIVYCSITGFGQDGPYADRSGYDYLVQAMGGIMSLTGVADGAAGAGPMRVGLPLADVFAGMNAAIAILAALRHAERTGEGQHIDIALLDSQVAALLNPFAAWLNNGEEISRTGNDHPSAAPYGPFRTADGYMLLATFNDREFSRVAAVVEHPEWATDARFAKSAHRVANRRLLADRLQGVLATQTTAVWIERFNAAKVSCGPINTMSQIAADPQITARGMVVSMPHPVLGELRLAGSPLRLSATPVSYRRLPPRAGEQSREILHEVAGMSEAEIDDLATAQVI